MPDFHKLQKSRSNRGGGELVESCEFRVGSLQGGFGVESLLGEFGVGSLPGRGGSFGARVAAACLAIAAAAAVRAAEWHVWPDEVDGMTGNQQLTNAFTKAVSGDVITIHEGTYNLAKGEMTFGFDDASGNLTENGICCYSTADNLTVRGAPDEDRDKIILSGLGTKAASAASGQRQIMRLEGESCTVRHLTFYKGVANTSTVYRNGKAIATSNWVYRRGGGVYFSSSSSLVEDCVFTSCYAGQGAAVYQGTVRDCVITGSQCPGSGNAGCALYGPKDVVNTSVSGSNRGAVRACTGVISNCTFSKNSHKEGEGVIVRCSAKIVDCTFSGNTDVCISPVAAGADMPSEITRCTFSGNTNDSASDLNSKKDNATYNASGYASAAGIAGYAGPVTDCTFDGGWQLEGCSGKVSGCRFLCGAKGPLAVDCPDIEDSAFLSNGQTLTGSETLDYAAVDNCGLVRCTVSDFRIHWGFLFLNVPSMKNCLVTGGSYWGAPSGVLFRYTKPVDALIENCTIADVASSSSMYYNDAESGTVTFRNCIFDNNKVGGQTQGAFDFYTANGDAYEAHLLMDHTIARAGDNGARSSAEFVGIENKWHRTFEPLFMKDKYPGEEQEFPYALYKKSPCIDAGTDAGWSEDDVDLAGAKRLNGAVDLGCYEWWNRRSGLTVILR